MRTLGEKVSLGNIDGDEDYMLTSQRLKVDSSGCIITFSLVQLLSYVTCNNFQFVNQPNTAPRGIIENDFIRGPCQYLRLNFLLNKNFFNHSP